MKLTTKQRKFVNSYIESGNATQAALDAGYSQSYAHAHSSKMLEKVGIKDAIEKRMKELEDSKIATADEVLKYLTEVIRGEAEETVIVATPKGAVEVTNRPSIHDRLAAGRDLMKRYPNSKELLDAQIRKAKADARTAEVKANAAEGITDDDEDDDGFEEALNSAAKDVWSDVDDE